VPAVQFFPKVLSSIEIRLLSKASLSRDTYKRPEVNEGGFTWRPFSLTVKPIQMLPLPKDGVGGSRAQILLRRRCSFNRLSGGHGLCRLAVPVRDLLVIGWYQLKYCVSVVFHLWD